MSNAKKTQAQNAMKPDKAAKASDAAKAQADAKAETSAETKQGTDIENPPSPDQREQESGTTQDDQAKAETGDPSDGVIEPDAAQKARDKAAASEVQEGEDASEEEELDLDNPEHATRLLEEVLEGVLSFSHPISGALANKPKVAESWDDLVKKVKKLHGKFQAEKAKAAK